MVFSEGQCGSCWDFAGVGVVETFHFVKTGQLINLSEQQVLDCSKGGSCGGGMPEQAIDWACKSGLCLTADYPYTARQGTCKQCAAKSTKCSGAKVCCLLFISLAHVCLLQKLASEAAQAQALEQNTVSIGVYIGSNFQSYKSGIFNGPCGSGGHAMVLVGFTSDSWYTASCSLGFLPCVCLGLSRTHGGPRGACSYALFALSFAVTCLRLVVSRVFICFCLCVCVVFSSRLSRAVQGYSNWARGKNLCQFSGHTHVPQ